MAYTTIKKPSDYFNTKIYTGNSSTLSVTGVGFQPDWTWIKDRNSAGDDHALYDAVRGATKRIRSNQTDAENTQSDGLTSFDSDGFTVGTNGASNGDGQPFVAWNWLASNTTSSNTDGSITSTVSANTTSGFSIVTYTGNGTVGATVGHGLSTPDVVLIKSRSASGSWIFNSFIMGSTGGTPDAPKNMYLEQNFGSQSDKICRNISANTFELSSSPSANSSGVTYVAYCFKNVKGYQKTGIYTGNGSTDGTFVYTGFKPAWVMMKRTDTTNDWFIFDSTRNTFNETDLRISANSSSAESDQTGSNPIDILSNGFKCRGTAGATNASGGTYIYMAFAEEPLVGDNPATAR